MDPTSTGKLKWEDPLLLRWPILNACSTYASSVRVFLQARNWLFVHKMCNKLCGMACELTGLQKQLLEALFESGLSRDSLLSAYDALCEKQAEISESADSTDEAELEDVKHIPSSSEPERNMPGRSVAVKIEESLRRTQPQGTRLEEQQQMNLLDHMLRYGVYLLYLKCLICSFCFSFDTCLSWVVLIDQFHTNHCTRFVVKLQPIFDRNVLWKGFHL